MSTAEMPATKDWRGRFFEDLEVGDVYRSYLGRTITEADNTWFTLLTMNTNQAHFNTPFAAGTRFGKIIVNSGLTVAMILGLSVADTSLNATANLEWKEIKMPNPVFVGDTLWSESKVLDRRESKSKPTVGIVKVATRGVNQRNEVVMQYVRSFMVYKRDAPEVTDGFPDVEADWAFATEGEA